MVDVELEESSSLVLRTDRPEIFERFPVSAILSNLQFQRVSRGVYRCSSNIVTATSSLVQMLSSRHIEYRQDEAVSELLRKQQNEIDTIRLVRNDAEAVKRGVGVQGEHNSIKGFRRTLYDYQIRALHHAIAVQNPANFSVPGSGKTTLAYAFFQYLKNQNIVDRMLVVCPISAFKVWEEEYPECIEPSNISGVVRLNGTNRHSFYGNTSNEVFITNFHLLPRDNELLREHLVNTGRYLMVVDEAHYVKNPGDGVIKTALLDLSPYAVRRMIATGTPCPNSLMDLHSQFAFLWPSQEITGSKRTFEEFIEHQTLESVRDKLFPFFYRIQKRELELPAPTMHPLRVPMGTVQRKIYEAIRERAMMHLHRLGRNDARLNKWRRAWVIRLNQVMSNPSLLIASDDDFEPSFVPPLDAHVVELAERYHQYEVPAKFHKCLQTVSELSSEGVSKIVVWTNFKKNVNQLDTLLSDMGWHVHVVTGDVSNDETVCNNRDQVIEEFRQNLEPAILLATPASCAESISLHKHCHHMIFVDLTFNAVHWMQAKDRIHRIGMERTTETHYYVLLTTNSYDDEIFDRVNEKENTMQFLLDSDFPVPSSDEQNPDISLDGLLSDTDELLQAIDDELEAWGRLTDE